MKKILTNLLASIAVICFALFALLSLSFHFGYLYYYEFYTMDSVVASIVWTALLIIISMIFEGNKSYEGFFHIIAWHSCPHRFYYFGGNRVIY